METAGGVPMFCIMRKIFWLLLVSALPVFCAAQQKSAPQWTKFQFMLGTWTATGSGSPGEGAGEFSFSFDLQQKVLELKIGISGEK